MICPLYLLAQSNPQDPYLILRDRVITFVELHQQVIACEHVLLSYPTSIPLAIDSTDAYSLISWMIAAARTGHWIAIPSSKDPPQRRDRLLNEISVYTGSLHWILPPLLSSSRDHIASSYTIEDPHRRWCMLFTSGSSGPPKSVVHSFFSLWSSAEFSHRNLPFSKGHRWLQSLFLWHIGGLMIPIRALYGGATVMEKDRSVTMGTQVHRDRITHLSVVATQLSDLLEEHQELTSLTGVLVGGGTIPSKLVERSHQRSIPIHTTYGMTELGSQLTTTPPQSSLKMLQSAGKPLGDWRIQISSDQEIQVQGSALFLGYWNGSAIEDPTDTSGWFRTKDRGTIVDGNLYPGGRVDQMFISGGENIHPEEIETVLHDLGIFSVVVSIPDDRYGKRPVAFVLADLSEDVLQEIGAAFDTHLPKFKHPDAIFSWPEEVDTYKPSRSTLQTIAMELLARK